MKSRIYLSSADYTGIDHLDLTRYHEDPTMIVREVNDFESRLQQHFHTDKKVLALNSATAAIHLALIMAGVEEGDYVLCQSMTFVASVNPVKYLGAIPVFIDSAPDNWSMDLNLLEQAFHDLTSKGKHVKCIINTSIYGMPSDFDALLAFAKANSLKLIEDSAEALGSLYKGEHTCLLADYGVISLNNNKIITSSGGGFLVCNDKTEYDKAFKLATQSKEPISHYQHEQVGYNYRMGHINAQLGNAQLDLLSDRLKSRLKMNKFYQKLFSDINGITVQKEQSDDYFSNHWLSAILVDPARTGGITREDLRLAFEQENIESRPLWKPMHMQPLYEKYPYYGGAVCETLFDQGLCLPSGSNLSDADRERIASVVQSVFC